MKRVISSLVTGLVLASPLAAQAVPLEVGTEAPDFEIPGATSAGVLDASFKLSDYRGQTVVLAFFFRARSGG
jgi:peroxiredoxin Q/BCP